MSDDRGLFGVELQPGADEETTVELDLDQDGAPDLALSDTDGSAEDTAAAAATDDAVTADDTAAAEVELTDAGADGAAAEMSLDDPLEAGRWGDIIDRRDVDGDGYWDMELRDADGDGTTDYVWADSNEDGYVDLEATDTNRDGELDGGQGLNENWDRISDSSGFDVDTIQRNPEQMDSDQDDLSNRDEYNLGTDAFEADSDGDSRQDNWELSDGTDPTDYHNTLTDEATGGAAANDAAEATYDAAYDAGQDAAWDAGSYDAGSYDAGVDAGADYSSDC